MSDRLPRSEFLLHNSLPVLHQQLGHPSLGIELELSPVGTVLYSSEVLVPSCDMSAQPATLI